MRATGSPEISDEGDFESDGQWPVPNTEIKLHPNNKGKYDDG